MYLDEAYRELNLVQDFLAVGSSNRPGTKLAPKFITIHNTDNASPGADAGAHAKYMKGPDARKRKVSWHFTVDDRRVFQSLPTSEVGWHTGTGKGNASSIGIEICMHAGIDAPAAYRRTALLIALMARRLTIMLPEGVVQHHHWSGKNCPRVLRAEPQRWRDLLQEAVRIHSELEEPAALDIEYAHDHEEAGVLDLQGELFSVVAKPNLRLRAGPGTEFDVVSSVPFGAQVLVISRFRDWSMVDLDRDGGGDGFVHSAFLKSAA